MYGIGKKSVRFAETAEKPLFEFKQEGSLRFKTYDKSDLD